MKHQKFLNKFSYHSIEVFDDFCSFLKYYYPTKYNHLIKTVDILRKFHPDYNQLYDENDVLNNLFENEKKDLNKLNKIYTALNKAFDYYLIYKHIENNNLEQILYKLKIAVQNNDVKSYEEEKLISSNLLHSLSRKNDDIFRLEYEINNLEYTYLIENDQRKGELNIQLVSDSFDKYWITRKLEIYLSMLSRKQMFNVDFTSDFIKDILKNIPNSKLINEPLIAILYQNIKLYEQPNEIEYNLFIDLLSTHQNNISYKDLRGYYSSAENILPLIFVNGNYFQPLFDLYEKQNKLGILILGSKIQATLFNNIITIGLRLGKLEWVNDFYNNHKMYLPKEDYHDYSIFNYVRLLFAQKKFDKLLTEVSDIEYKNIEIKLGIKRLLSKTFFELKELQLLEHHLNSFKVFIGRHNELSNIHQEMHKLFLKYFYKLLKISQDPDHKSANKIIQEIKKTPNLIDKSWFIEKLEKM